MKQLKILGLAALAVLALSAVSAASASATTVCGVSTNPCPSGNVLAAGDILHGSLAAHGGATTAVLTGSAFGIPITVTCSTSSVDGVIVTNPGTPVTGNMTSVTFGDCKDQAGGNCTATTNASSTNPWSVTVSTGFTVTVGTASVTCAGFTCNYGGNNVTGTIYNPGAAGAPDPTNAHGQVFFNAVTLNSKTFGCSNGTWTGNYQVTTSSAKSPSGDVWVF